MSQLSHSIFSNIFSKLFGFLGIIFILLALNVHMMRTNDFKVLNEYLGISKIFAAIVYDPEDCYAGSVQVDCNSKWHNAPATTTVRIQNGGVGAITYTTTILPPPPPVISFGGGDGGGGH